MFDKSQQVLRLEALRKSYNIDQPNEIEVLHGIDLTIGRSDFAALIGPSGSGKSTLLNLLGLLDKPTSGELYLQGKPTSAMSDNQLTAMRGSNIGFVFQFHHLISAFSVLDNVLMPLMLNQGKPNKLAIEKARELLVAVGLEKFINSKPGQLSGGQQQRVAIARALITDPPLLLADEPTGNLDTRTAAEVFELFRKVNKERGCAILLVTHDPRLSAACDRTINLVDGRIESDSLNN
ncbi:lipoprotein-releasing system ATP-binding protein LolD [Psychrosphaera saromensis]|uniref:ABC transporter ATP-binding protein n=1 Tax=Psychrosphaera saromensis TaxID=716813 RepID=A0A2S7UTT5_9GAMM|nr:ABC transporter ATP-binding protein [Psychrosphaera saromensis]PQJ52690.1 ABC transporter ATP-binding protein [Psychrosphaera saromensis]GHB70490.1 lipoprotein-releasing system ATP-binding protein LolD [Psychrosphaera saromensis]GLQ13174.1 lipoprotein-releasing system ATP-binding protein LolD [Psychrosphaera saromensis]